MTIRRAIEKITSLGYYSAAKWAVSQITGINHSKLLLHLDDELSDHNEKAIQDVIARLEKNEPMQYVLGRWQFIDIEIKTDKRALIPRPETELLAEHAVKKAKEVNARSIADIGSGTGCIGLYIKSKIPGVKVSLYDISQDALDLAKENADSLNLECSFMRADMRDIDYLQCDLIVSNPPYIKTCDISGLDANVRDYEPHLALDGGEDGLDYYRALAKLADASFLDKGAILLEIGAEQCKDVKDIFSKYFAKISVIKDFGGIERIVIAERG
jgi:release factor glutamine methyltransferase